MRREPPLDPPLQRANETAQLFSKCIHFELPYFGGFQKYEYFWDMKLSVDTFGSHY